MTITNQLFRDVIRTAYSSNDMEIIGGPDWMVVDRWDILAAAAPGDPDAPWQLMLKLLLTERFNPHGSPQACLGVIPASYAGRLGIRRSGE